MEGPISEYSDSDSGESWTLLDNDTTHLADSSSFETQKLNKSVTEDTCEKDEDTDGISIISDSEPESPFHIESSVIICSTPEAAREEIPVYNPQDIDLETNVTCREKDTEPLVEDNESGDNINHKIYVHRRNNRLSTVLNIVMFVSVMTAAGVAIGHMWGVKHDCPTQSTPSFNKILSDLYKLQAENANYRNKLRELSLIIEDNLHYECERESELSLNKQQTAECRQQKVHNIQKYLKSNTEEGKKYKRSINSYPQKQDENKLKKPKQNQLPLQNISKIKPIKREEIDKMSIPEIIVNDETLDQDKYEGKDNTIWKGRKITYADSLKRHNINININDENVYQNDGKNEKHYKKVKGTKDWKFLTEEDRLEISNSEEEFVKDKHTTPKHKLKQKTQKHQKPFKNSKRRNKHENWDIKEGILKYYDDISNEHVDSNDFVKNKIIQDVTEANKPYTIKESNDAKLHLYDDYFKQEGTGKKYIKTLNWYDNRAQLRKEARSRQQQELLNASTRNSGEWYFKRMHKREECRDKENSTCKGNNKKKNFKTKPYK